MAVDLILRFSFDKQIFLFIENLYLQSTYKQFQIKRNIESVWNYYSHNHLVEGIGMLLLHVNKIALSR